MLLKNLKKTPRKNLEIQPILNNQNPEIQLKKPKVDQMITRINNKNLEIQPILNNQNPEIQLKKPKVDQMITRINNKNLEIPLKQ